MRIKRDLVVHKPTTAIVLFRITCKENSLFYTYLYNV